MTENGQRRKEHKAGEILFAHEGELVSDEKQNNLKVVV